MIGREREKTADTVFAEFIVIGKCRLRFPLVGAVVGDSKPVVGIGLARLVDDRIEILIVILISLMSH